MGGGGWGGGGSALTLGSRLVNLTSIAASQKDCKCDKALKRRLAIYPMPSTTFSPRSLFSLGGSGEKGGGGGKGALMFLILLLKKKKLKKEKKKRRKK